MNIKNKKGFTLIELLVVIAIIGILAAIAMVNLNSARNKAKVASFRANLDSLQAGMVLCQDSGANLSNAGNAGSCGTSAITPVEGGGICTTGSTIGVWPNLPIGTMTGTNCNSSLSSGTWMYQANSTGTGINCFIKCKENTGCKVSGTSADCS